MILEKFLLRRPFIIAEISCNHLGNKKMFDKIVKKAFDCGASAVKFQTSTPNCLTRNFDGNEFYVNKSKNNLWGGMHLFDLYKKTCTPVSWSVNKIIELKKMKQLGFSTPFSVEMLEILEKKAKPLLYKISSLDWNYLDLLKKCISKKKPVLLSLTNPEKQVKFLYKNGVKKFIPMYCISKYPATLDHLSMKQLDFVCNMNTKYKGFSDHSLTDDIAVIAVSKGINILEKHFILDKKHKSEDAAFSVDPEGFKKYVNVCNKIYQAKHNNKIFTTLTNGRSLYFDVDLKKNQIIKKKYICCIRPGGGLDSSQLKKIIGSRVKTNIKRGKKVSYKDIS
jgi:pseudaminic acid synthase